jgi:hypothetical protein
MRARERAGLGRRGRWGFEDPCLERQDETGIEQHRGGLGVVFFW